MLNCVYRLVSPRVFQPLETSVSIAGDAVVVRPTHLSICNADQRYYQGKRSADVLAKKLPMALIHEGVGTVVRDASQRFSPGDHVVLLPNAPVEESPVVGENYLRSSRFCGSGFDGFMQELVVLPARRLVALPSGVDLEVASFTELVSVAMHAISRFEATAHGKREVIGVWGDGNVGFIVSLLLRMKYPNAVLVVLGRNRYKLDDFTFADKTLLTCDISNAPMVDHAFECCGGDGAAGAIDQIIDVVSPEGTVALLGVTENPVPVNTRMVLEKGLRLVGSSRSSRDDFKAVIELYRQRPEVPRYLSGLVNGVVAVDSIAKMNQAFQADLRKSMGKTVMEWNV